MEPGDSSVASIEHGNPWFDDGNIILQTRSTRFKVYRGILSESSVIFKDMLAIPTPASEELYEGCPIVLLDDAPSDLHHVLCALFRGRNYNISSKLQPFCVLAAFLRLGTKYEIEQLRSEAVNRISVEYPSQLDQWDTFQSKKSTMSQMHPERSNTFDVINLAQEINMPSLLPAAFYTCVANYDIQEVLDGIVRDDGSLATLPTTSQHKCMQGLHRLLKKKMQETFVWMDERFISESYTCIASGSGGGKKRCFFEKRDLFYKTWFSSPRCMALTPWIDFSENNMCMNCRDSSREAHYIGRIKIWQELPSMFGLGNWDELLKE